MDIRSQYHCLPPPASRVRWFSLLFVRFFRRYRPLLVSCAMLLTAGCIGWAAPPSSDQTEAGPATERPTTRNCVGSYHAERLTGDFAGYAGLHQFIDHMVRTHGFEAEYLQGLFSQARRMTKTLNYLAKSDQALQGPPAAGGWSRYRSKFLNDRHIDAGVEFARHHQDALRRASRQFGVPEEIILGILAVETKFGRHIGKDRVLDALTTLGFDYERRGDYFRGELENFLLMARSEGMDPAKPVGSYAGAMGLGQFMPTSFLRWAVDFNGDGHRDLWDAEDAIGSIANYFAQHGWLKGHPVITPLKVNGPVNLQPGLTPQYTMAALQQAGLQPVRPCYSGGPLRLLLLRHTGFDQYLIGHPNFYTLTRYNNSTYYAMAVYELSLAIKWRR